MKFFFLYTILIFCFFTGRTQSIIGEQQLIDSILERSLTLSNAKLEIQAQQFLQKTSWDLNDPEIIVEQNPFESLTLSIDQSLHFPLQYVRQGQLNTERVHLSESEFTITKHEIKNQSKKWYLQMQYLQSKNNLLSIQDSLSLQIKTAVSNSFDAGNSTYLEKLYGESSYGETHQEYLNAQNELSKLQNQLKILSGVTTYSKYDELSRRQILKDSIQFQENPYLIYARQNQNVVAKQYEKTKSEALPDILLGYTIPLQEDPVYVPSFKAGITIPLWYNSYRGFNQNAKTEIEIAENNVKLEEQNLMQAASDAYLSYYQNEQSLRYYEKEALPRATEMIKSAMRLNEAGEIDYISCLRLLQDAFQIKLNYIAALYNFNNAVIQIEYLNGN
jgi:cobalt-zinc-cadmium resistance protein CzcA